MAQLNTPQVSADAIDTTGLSVVTSPRRIGDQRYGVAYNNDQLAAAVPVHFHPLDANRYLMLFNRRWSQATSSPQTPGAYSSYTEDTTPGWAQIAVPSGNLSPVGTAGDYTIPIQHDYDELTLVDAVSRTTEYLYMLFSGSTKLAYTAPTTGASGASGASGEEGATGATGTPAATGPVTVTTGVIAHWWNNPTTKAFTALAQEPVPSGAACPENFTALAWNALSVEERMSQGLTVVFDKGLQFQSPHIVVYGTDSLNRLYAARKPWARIGNNIAAKPYSSSTFGALGATAEDPRWTYFTGTGWSLDYTELKPMTDHRNEPITSAGPVSVATYRDQTFLSTVAQEITPETPGTWEPDPTGASGDYGSYIPGATGETKWVAQVYAQRKGRAFAPAGQVPLGSTNDNSYLQETLRFQAEVPPNADLPEMQAGNAALPYVISTRTTLADTNALTVSEGGTVTVPGDEARGTLAATYTPQEFPAITALTNSWGVWPVVRTALPVTPGSPLDATLNAVCDFVADASVVNLNGVS